MDTNGLVIQHMNIVDNVCNKFFFPPWSILTKEDLKQVGYMGLIKAAQTHDETRGPFEEHAYFCIRGKVINEIKKFSRMSRKPQKPVDSLNFVYTNEDQPYELLDFVEGEENVEDAAMYNLMKMDFERSINELSHLEKRIVKLYINGLRQRDIADKIGCSQMEVSRQLKRIKAKVVA